MTERFPMPDDAPPPRSCIRVERPEPGLVLLVLDPPHRPSLAVLDVPLLRDLETALAEVTADARLSGLVVTGRSPLSFAGGADVKAIEAIEDPALAADLARYGQKVFGRLAALGRTGGGRLMTVAAVGGPVPGGACELALACDRIVLADDPKSRIGLPEVRLGILPGWGGTHRLPRRIGMPQAVDSILSGKLHRPRAAQRIGLVDRLAHPDLLVRVASAIALGRKPCPRRGRGVWEVLVDKNPLAGWVVERAAGKRVAKETGGHYPAPLRALPMVVRAPRVPLAEGFEQEALAVGELAVGPVAKSLVSILIGTEDAKRLARQDGGEALPFRRAAVIGGGVMGGAIAGLLAERGLDVRLRDLELAALDAAQHAHRAEIQKKRRRRSLERHEADAAMDRLEVTQGDVGFGRCDFALEAVAERMEVKRAVLGELSAKLPASAVLATNTSSLSVGAMAEAVPHPERVVGMHFFNPVRRMPLVEVVRAPATTDEVVARTAKLALDLGKTPVVVRDVPGFLVNRVLGPYLDEALRLHEEGLAPAHVDALMKGFGMPMGPFRLLDEVGLDIASHAAAALEAAYGERMAASSALAVLVEHGELGTKTRRGIYRYERDRRGKQLQGALNPRLARAGAPTRVVSDEEVVDRLVLAMVNEAARCLQEGVVAGARELDLATVLGMGFAPFHGGLLRYADRRGLGTVSGRLAELADLRPVRERRGGPARFAPAEILGRLAREGRRFHAPSPSHSSR